VTQAIVKLITDHLFTDLWRDMIPVNFIHLSRFAPSPRYCCASSAWNVDTMRRIDHLAGEPSSVTTRVGSPVIAARQGISRA